MSLTSILCRLSYVELAVLGYESQRGLSMKLAPLQHSSDTAAMCQGGGRTALTPRAWPQGPTSAPPRRLSAARRSTLSEGSATSADRTDLSLDSHVPCSTACVDLAHWRAQPMIQQTSSRECTERLIPPQRSDPLPLLHPSPATES